MRFLKKCGEIFALYIRGNLLDAVIVAGAAALFLYLIGAPHIVLIALLAGVTNLIPSVGPVIGGAAGAILLLFDKPVNSLWYLLFFVVLQLLDSYVLKPKLFGSALGVPSAVVLLATLAGGFFFGLPGLLLAVPLAAILCLILRTLFRKKENGSDGEAQ